MPDIPSHRAAVPDPTRAETTHTHAPAPDKLRRSAGDKAPVSVAAAEQGT